MRPERVRAGVTAGLDDGDVHAAAAHVLDRHLGQPQARAAPLMFGIDGDHVDHAHALVEGVERDSDEAHGPAGRNGDEGVVIRVRTTRSDRLGLTGPPVRMQPQEDRVPEDVAH